MDKKHDVEIALHAVKDPEIPSISIEELGMLYEICIEQSHVIVKLIPTFVGCPALDIISSNIKKAITEKVSWVESIDVVYIYDVSWSTERITPSGREKLKEYGIAPPPLNYKEGEAWTVECPYCGSSYTAIENIFGPAACRSILYCKSCRNPFEAMKPVVARK
ncbi:phenylacetate-CoA oxygenase subunit PaaJ [Anoxybacillus salavatliensis]|uniref:1,2-phenylacetyl-CoA epoxidase subunit PaaD n=1 Tax=Anoxybacillus gonensis TaxID=198467 RepID=UPI00214C672B|nr:1,2-phenylacetyl-CoA epoxidase subunit PaaD [Anoxybacillus gonensis]MCQ5364858.1 phenylacetate-CoA oxygenase subunit PaaJ [Anoxybacillus gonensis]